MKPPARRFDEQQTRHAQQAEALIQRLGRAGMEMSVLEGLPLPVLAEIHRVVDGLRQQLRDLNQDPDEATELSPQQKGAIGEAFFERHSEQFKKLRTTRQSFLEGCRHMPPDDVRRLQQP